MGLSVSIPVRFVRTFTAVAYVCLLAAAPPSARADRHAKQPKENRRAESHHIESLEQDWLHSLIQGDTATLERLMAEDFLAISASGTLSDKQQYLHRLGSGENSFTNIDVMEMKVRVQSSAAVVVSQVRVVGQLDGRPVNGVFRYTKVYGRALNGQWHVLNLEATRVSGVQPDEPGMHRGTPMPPEKHSSAGR